MELAGGVLMIRLALVIVTIFAIGFATKGARAWIADTFTLEALWVFAGLILAISVLLLIIGHFQQKRRY